MLLAIARKPPQIICSPVYACRTLQDLLNLSTSPESISAECLFLIECLRQVNYGLPCRSRRSAEQPMTEQQIYRRVRKVVAETLAITEHELRPGTRITEDLKADSMQVVAILIALDDEFDTEFRPEDIPSQSVTLRWITEFVALTITAQQTRA